MNIESQKEFIIKHLNSIEDEELVNAIKSILDYGLKKEREKQEIPLHNQKLVMERFNKVRKDPARLLDWDEAKKDLKA